MFVMAMASCVLVGYGAGARKASLLLMVCRSSYPLAVPNRQHRQPAHGTHSRRAAEPTSVVDIAEVALNQTVCCK